MQLNFLKSSIVFLIFSNIQGCVEPFYPPPIDGDKILVIDGLLDITKKTANVSLTYSRDLNSRELPEFITNADLSIEEENGNVMPIVHIDSGNYFAKNLNVDFNKNYRLVINNQGKTYISNFVQAKPTPDIDSIYWKPKNDGIGIYLNTHDPENKSIYYKWNYEEAWHFRADYYSFYDFNYETKEVTYRDNWDEHIYDCWKFTYPKNILIGSTVNFSKDIINEQLITFIPPSSSKAKIKYSILVKQQTIDKQAYEYWNKVKGNTESLGTLFDPIPYAFEGNIHSASSPNEVVLGYFSVGATKMKRLFINYYEVKGLFEFPRSGCTYDTVKIHELYKLYRFENILHEVGEDAPWGYAYTTDQCSDCTYYGTNIKPDFWE